MATEKQVAMFSYQIRANREATKAVFPDRMIAGANLYLRDAEKWAREQDSQALSDIIGSFLYDDTEMAIKQIKYLMK